MAKSYKERVYEILEATDPEDRVAEAANLVMLILVVSNVIAVILETVDSLYLVYRDLFRYFAGISIIIFTIEYLLRIWSCDVEPEYRQPILGRRIGGGYRFKSWSCLDSSRYFCRRRNPNRRAGAY